MAIYLSTHSHLRQKKNLFKNNSKCKIAYSCKQNLLNCIILIRVQSLLSPLTSLRLQGMFSMEIFLPLLYTQLSKRNLLTVCVGIPWLGNRKEHTDPFCHQPCILLSGLLGTYFSSMTVLKFKHRSLSATALVTVYSKKLFNYGPRRNIGMQHDVIFRYEARQVFWFSFFCIPYFFLFKNLSSAEIVVILCGKAQALWQKTHTGHILDVVFYFRSVLHYYFSMI